MSKDTLQCDIAGHGMGLLLEVWTNVCGVVVVFVLVIHHGPPGRGQCDF